MSLFDNLDLVSWLLIAFSLITLISLFKRPAPYGKYSKKVLVNYSLRPKISWFIQESPSFFVPLFYLMHHFLNGGTLWIPNVALLLCFGLHYFQRSFIYAMKIKSTKEVPVEIFLAAFCFCSFNGFLQSHYLLIAHYQDTWFYQVNFWTGLILFFAGMAINIHSDNILLQLRSSDQSYKIPQGGLFDFVSGANYFGEIVEWAGFAIASLSLPSFAFLILTICNIGPRAKQHHEWYKKQFDNYPKDRKCLIPFVW